eukprot:COSAG02_NODE_7652_length_2912_cov_1.996801_2_plen_65_part_00
MGTDPHCDPSGMARRRNTNSVTQPRAARTRSEARGRPTPADILVVVRTASTRARGSASALIFNI